MGPLNEVLHKDLREPVTFVPRCDWRWRESFSKIWKGIVPGRGAIEVRPWGEGSWCAGGTSRAVRLRCCEEERAKCLGRADPGEDAGPVLRKMRGHSEGLSRGVAVPAWGGGSGQVQMLEDPLTWVVNQKLSKWGISRRCLFFSLFSRTSSKHLIQGPQSSSTYRSWWIGENMGETKTGTCWGV